MDRIERGGGAALRLCWRPHGRSTTWATSSGTTRLSLLPPAFKSTVSGCRSSNANASPSATSRTIMNLNRRDTRCSSIDSVNAKKWHKACIFCVAMDKEAFQSNSFLHRVMVCMLGCRGALLPQVVRCPLRKRPSYFRQRSRFATHARSELESLAPLRAFTVCYSPR